MLFINEVATSCGNDNGTVSIVASGAAPFQYSIDGGVTFSPSSSFSDLAAGAYSIQILDANSCTTDGLASIPASASPAIDLVSPSLAACGMASGGLSISVSGGTAPLMVSIDGGVTFSASTNFSNLAADNYDIVVQDAAGCDATQSFQLAEIAGPEIESVVPQSPSCENSD